MKKAWVTPDVCDLTIRATKFGGGNCNDDNPSPEMFHSSGAEGDGMIGGNMPGMPGNGGGFGGGNGGGFGGGFGHGGKH